VNSIFYNSKWIHLNRKLIIEIGEWKKSGINDLMFDIRMISVLKSKIKKR